MEQVPTLNGKNKIGYLVILLMVKKPMLMLQKAAVALQHRRWNCEKHYGKNKIDEWIAEGNAGLSDINLPNANVHFTRLSKDENDAYHGDVNWYMERHVDLDLDYLFG